MAFHGIDAASAVEMLRTHADQIGLELGDVCEALVSSHHLLAPQPPLRPPAA